MTPGTEHPLQIARTIAEARVAIAAARRAGKAVGLVPTMGALHEGHLSLVRRAREECDFVVLTIFVNPTQFAPGEDYAQYPRAEERDRALAEAEAVDLVFAPSTEEMYPPGALTTVHVDELTEVMCGPFRPGHFDGVTTVVAKLLNITTPDRAYFGQKDFQQLQILRRMTRTWICRSRSSAAPPSASLTAWRSARGTRACPRRTGRRRRRSTERYWRAYASRRAEARPTRSRRAFGRRLRASRGFSYNTSRPVGPIRFDATTSPGRRW